MTEKPTKSSFSASREENCQWGMNAHPRTISPNIPCTYINHVTNSHQWNVGRSDIFLEKPPKEQVALFVLFSCLLAGCSKLQGPGEGRESHKMEGVWVPVSSHGEELPADQEHQHKTVLE